MVVSIAGSCEPLCYLFVVFFFLIYLICKRLLQSLDAITQIHAKYSSSVEFSHCTKCRDYRCEPPCCLFVFGCFAFMGMCTMYIPDVCRGQKRTSYHRELQLQTPESSPVGAMNQILVLCKGSKVYFFPPLWGK